MSDPRVIAEFSDYPRMLDAFRLLAIQRQIAVSGDANEIAGLPQGYIQKLIGAKPSKRLGIVSLGPLLGVLGAKLILVEDAQAIKRFGSQLRKRDQRFVRSGSVHVVKLTSRHLQKIGRVGGNCRASRMSPEARTDAARAAAVARWAKVSPKNRSEHGRRLVRCRWSSRRKAARENSRKRHREAT